MAEHFSVIDHLAGFHINEILRIGLEAFDPRRPLSGFDDTAVEESWEADPLLDESANLFVIPLCPPLITPVSTCKAWTHDRPPPSPRL